MSIRCSSDYTAKLALMTSQVKQYRAMLEATEKAAERRLFPAHIYAEDKTVIQGKIVKKLLDMRAVMKQCTHP
jgi:hypothetical protein